MSSKYVDHILAQINEVSEDFMVSDLQTGMMLHRLASNIATAFIDNDLLIDHLNVDDETKSRIAAMVKEAVSMRKPPKKISKKIK